MLFRYLFLVVLRVLERVHARTHLSPRLPVAQQSVLAHLAAQQAAVAPRPLCLHFHCTDLGWIFVPARVSSGKPLFYGNYQHLLRPFASSAHLRSLSLFLFLVVVLLFSLFFFRPFRLLLSLFSEGKAWELASFLASSGDKVGVTGSAARGDRGEAPSAGGVGGVGGATPPSAKRAWNSLSR